MSVEFKKIFILTVRHKYLTVGYEQCSSLIQSSPISFCSMMRDKTIKYYIVASSGYNSITFLEIIVVGCFSTVALPFLTKAVRL